MRFVVIGNLENRRVTMFVDAAKRLGLPEPLCVSHLDLIDDPTRLPHVEGDDVLVRVDSTGENVDVDRALLALGTDEPGPPGSTRISREALADYELSPYEVFCPTQLHLGFLAYLRALYAHIAERPGWRVSPSFDAIDCCFDKRKTWERLSAAGIPVAPRIIAETADELRAAMDAHGVRRVFVKLLSGSSASGLAAYHRAGNFAMTSTTRRDGRWVNKLGVRRYQRPEEVDALLNYLFHEGAHVEVAMPKAKWDGATFDLRVLCIGGEPTFVVVRQSKHPITNLHLGGWRGDVEGVRQHVGESTWARIMDVARRAAAVFDAHQIGFDILVGTDLQDVRVIEANAFGDLLPNLEKDGLDVYAYQIQQLMGPPRQGQRA